jgi:hypothetical protein
MSALQLDFPPIFNGIAATEGRLFIACENGSLVCPGRN